MSVIMYVCVRCHMQCGVEAVGVMSKWYTYTYTVHALLWETSCVVSCFFFAPCRAERTGGSQRSSSVASERSLQEHKRHSSHTKHDSFHDNHRRRHSSSSNKSNSHNKKRRKRESSQLSSDDSDHRGKRSKGKKRKKHRHSNKNSSPQHTEETN